MRQVQKVLLKQAGFDSELEIEEAISRLLRRHQPPLSQEQQQLQGGGAPVLLSEIFRAREEAELARKEQHMLNASLQQLLHPTSVMDHKLFFPRSWLLKHDPLKSWLEAIWKIGAVGLKRGILQILRHEKNAFKWYSGGIPKSYFTCAIGKRLLQYSPTPHGTELASALEQELKAISVEIEEGTALLSKQNKDRVPLIFIQANEKEKEKNPRLRDQQQPTNNDGEDGSDNEIQILDEEEIRQLKRHSCSSAVPAAIEVDDGRP